MKTADREFLAEARERYVRANAATLDWLLSRPPLHDAFLNTKQNSITLADYDATSGWRGPDFTFGWIQGRGLESLVRHAGYLTTTDSELVERLDQAGRRLFATLGELWARDGHIYFCYDRDLRPVYPDANDVIRPQNAAGDIFTYSDAFGVKGLIAAAARYDRNQLPRFLAALADIVAAIENGRFLMDERQPLTRDAIARQADDYGPRMILLGAAGLLSEIGKPDAGKFAERFIAHVLGRHVVEDADRPGGLVIRDAPGADHCNPGHAIEFVGFALEALSETIDSATKERLVAMLDASFSAGFTGPGIRLSVSAVDGAPLSPNMPWWSLPETVRAAATAFWLTGDQRALDIWRRADAAFFTHYWRGDPPIAYQTRDCDGPVDYVPATPDLDPGYHTGLSFLGAIEAIDWMLCWEDDAVIGDASARA